MISWIHFWRYLAFVKDQKQIVHMPNQIDSFSASTHLFSNIS